MLSENKKTPLIGIGTLIQYCIPINTMITEIVHFNRLLFMVVAMASAASICLWRS